MSLVSDAFQCVNQFVAVRCVMAWPERLLQVRERVKEVGFHRADRTAQHVGDLLVRHVVIGAHDQRGALFRRQGGDCSPHDGRALFADHHLLRTLDADILELVHRLDRFCGGPGRLRAHAIETHVDGDAIQPGRERRLPLKFFSPPLPTNASCARSLASS